MYIFIRGGTIFRITTILLNTFISKLITGRRTSDQRRAKNPKCDWTDSDATPLSEDTIGNPYGAREENGTRVEHTSADKNREYYVGDIVRKKGKKCTQELKKKLVFAGLNEINCRVKVGLVMMVQN